MNSKQKVELIWDGKEKRQCLEPRILVEVPEKSYHAKEKGDNDIFDNMLIHGDNLLALKALEQEYSGQVKCIYIDPPYNTGNAFDHYDDCLEHSIWLGLMRDRIDILYNLLSEDGLLFVQIDDVECAYLTIMLDEIFGRDKRLNTICVKMSEASGVKMAHSEKRLPKMKEYILIYFKKNIPLLQVEKESILEWNDEYKHIITGISENGIDELHKIISMPNVSIDDINRCNTILSQGTVQSLAQYLKQLNVPKDDQEKWKFSNAKYIIQAVGSTSVFNIAKKTQMLPQDIMAVKSATGLAYLIKTDVDMNAKQPRVQVIFADENLMRNPGDLWLDIKTTGGVGQEGGVIFARGKKPEKLIKKIISMCTVPGDLVLDSFLGSGTTAAVAHKMGRRWIGIELGDHCYTHCIPRLQRVIDGTDQGGITKAVDWHGGGGFRFFELGE